MQAIKVLQIQKHAPFVVCKFVAVVIPGDNVHEQDVLGFRVKACDLHLVAGKHPPRGHTQEKKLKRFGGEKKNHKKKQNKKTTKLNASRLSKRKGPSSTLL